MEMKLNKMIWTRAGGSSTGQEGSDMHVRCAAVTQRAVVTRTPNYPTKHVCYGMPEARAGSTGALLVQC